MQLAKFKHFSIENKSTTHYLSQVEIFESIQSIIFDNHRGSNILTYFLKVFTIVITPISENMKTNDSINSSEEIDNKTHCRLLEGD